WRIFPASHRGIAPALAHPERLVVVTDDVHDSVGDLRTVCESASRGAVAVCAEPPDRLRSQDGAWPERMIPALRVERQGDLSTDAVSALAGVKAAHRALVVTPREALDLRDAIMGYVGGRHVRLPHRTPRIVQEKHIDLVVVRGPVGSDAGPMHPAWA